jgi:hypothetical protein
MRLRLLVAIFVILASAGRINAQIQYPLETRNAALRYWIAFAEMQDVSTDKSTQELLEKTASGAAAWDEEKLAPILDANKKSIQMMQRATKLPECDWGLEYSQGPRASIAYAPRARALGRLNTLEGMRQLAAGDSQAAVNAWLAGVRFSEDLARGGSLIFALMAKATLLPNLRELTEATTSEKLSEAQKKQVSAAIRVLPEDGFDWGAAWGIEAATLEQFLHELQNARNPGATYEAAMKSPAPKQGLPPTAQDIHIYSDYMLAVQSALREPPEKAKILLDGLEPKRAALNEVEQNITPSPQKSNLTRIDVMTARTQLLQALAKK